MVLGFCMAFLDSNLFGRKMNKGDILIKEERDKFFYQITKDQKVFIEKKEILDFGCGEGFVMDLFSKWGASPNLLTGVDISKKRITLGKSKFPEFNFIHVNNKLPFEENKFSLIIISTVFSSIINSQDREHWASEIDRVLNLNGLIIFYDMKINNPFNRKIRKVTKNELSSLFCDYTIKINSLTVWPHFSRLLSIISNKFYPLLTNIKLLHTHFIAELTKKKKYDENSIS